MLWLGCVNPVIYSMNESYVRAISVGEQILRLKKKQGVRTVDTVAKGIRLYGDL